MHRSRCLRLVLVCLASLSASIAWTIAGGQDLNFDLITYHFYLGYSGFASRFDLDFLPAGLYGYQSPLPFMPMYWLDRIGISPVTNAAIHAAFHAVNLVVLYLLTELLVGKATRLTEHIKIAALWLLGAIAPIYWTLVGTSFADLSTSVPVLAGLWLVARNAVGSTARIAWIAAAGVLLGIATGARPHNAIYVAALFCGLAMSRFPEKKRLFPISVFLLAAFGAWLTSFGPWAYRLYREFGNPFFPLFNGLFRSPDFPASNAPFLSFTPGGFLDLIMLPFWMATDAAWIYVELPLPDVRPALLTLCLIAVGLTWLYSVSQTRNHMAHKPDAIEVGTVSSRRLILVFFSVSGILWLATSANGRFGVALLMLAGPVCGTLIFRLLPRRYAFLVIACAVLWQALLQDVFFRQYRFNSMPWSSRFFDWNVDQRLTQHPATFVSFGFQPGSTLAPRLHPGSSHINLSGHPAVDAPGSEKIRRLISLPNRSLYGVFDVTLQNPILESTIKTHYTNHARLWGLDFTRDPCDLITLKQPGERFAALNQAFNVEFRYRPPVFLACKLQQSSSIAHAGAVKDFELFKKKLSALGATCPQYFDKPLGYVHAAKHWTVTGFASSEISFRFDHNGRFYLQLLRPPHVTLDLGRVSRDAILPDEPDCRKWFAKLSELSAKARKDSIEWMKQ